MSVSFKVNTLSPPSPLLNAGQPGFTPVNNGLAPLVDETAVTRLEIASKPQLRADRPAFRAPMKGVEREALDTLRGAIKVAKQNSDQVERMFKRERKDASSAAGRAAPGPGKFMATQRFDNLAAAEKRVEARGAALDQLDAAAGLFEQRLKAVHDERAKPIPMDRTARNKLFDNLVKLEKDVAEAAESMRAAFDAFDAATAQITDADMKLVGVEGVGVNGADLNPFRKHAEQKDLIGKTFTAATLVPAAKQSEDGPATVETQMSDATNRALRLKEQLNEFENDFERHHLERFLGDGTLKVGVALQAIRAGESLSPALLRAITDEARIRDVEPLGEGSFNVVYKARLEDPPGTVNTYALKPLDSRPGTPGDSAHIGHSVRQVGVFGRQHAAHALSEALGLSVAGEPRYVVHNDRLYMAVPIIPGHTKDVIREKLAGAVATHNTAPGTAAAKDPVGEEQRIFEALHNNPKFQMACQKMQLMQSVISNPDGHGDNMCMSFSKDGHAVEPGDLVGMTSAQIAQLDVNAGVFDLDGAFLADPNIKPKEVDKSWFGPGGGIIANRWHYVGPPPFHTKDQYDALVALQANLNAALGQDLSWDLTSGYDNEHPKTETTELAALKSRVDQLVALFEQQHHEGRRLDNDGRVLDADNEPTGGPNQQRGFSDSADRIGQWRLGNGNKVKMSLAHKFFPIEGSVANVEVPPPVVEAVGMGGVLPLDFSF